MQLRWKASGILRVSNSPVLPAMQVAIKAYERHLKTAHYVTSRKASGGLSPPGALALTCNSCHNPHEKEKGNTRLFSQRCMSWHTTGVHVDFRKQTGISDEDLKNNCIDCHMPLKPLSKVAVMLPGDPVPTAALIRSHRIAVYPGETNRILNSMVAPQKK